MADIAQIIGERHADKVIDEWFDSLLRDQSPVRDLALRRSNIRFYPSGGSGPSCSQSVLPGRGFEGHYTSGCEPGDYETAAENPDGHG